MFGPIMLPLFYMCDANIGPVTKDKTFLMDCIYWNLNIHPKQNGPIWQQQSGNGGFVLLGKNVNVQTGHSSIYGPSF